MHTVICLFNVEQPRRTKIKKQPFLFLLLIIKTNIMKQHEIARRLEYLRNELREERISYGELAELTSLIPYIDKSDTELLEAAGVPEF